MSRAHDEPANGSADVLEHRSGHGYSTEQVHLEVFMPRLDRDQVGRRRVGYIQQQRSHVPDDRAGLGPDVAL